MPPARRTRAKPDPAVLSALAHPLRMEILRRSGKPITPKDIADATGEPLGNVSYHSRTLAEAGLLRLVRTEPRRGAVAHFYVVPAAAKKKIAKAGTALVKFADGL